MEKMTTRWLCGFAAMVVTGSVFAQTWPQHAIRWVSPFAPGGGTDITSRIIAPRLSSQLGQQVVVDNRGGAGGMIGVDLVAKSPPDGYTVVIGSVGPIAINVSLYSKMAYDPKKDLVPVARVANALNVLVVHPSLPVKNVKEFVAFAKSHAGQLNYGSSGSGATDHLAGELFNALTGAKLVHIPYKGGAPAMLDLIAGNVQLVFSTVSTAVGSIQGKKIRALAMTGNQRFELMPELPTMEQAGLKGFEVNNWYALFAPAGTPKDIVARLNTEVVKILALAEVQKRLLESGIVAAPSSPEQLAVYVDAETRKWAKVIKDANIKAE